MRIFTKRGFTEVKLTDKELSTILTCIAIAKNNWHLRDKEVSITSGDVMEVFVKLLSIKEE